MEKGNKRPTVVASAFINKDGKYLLTFCPKFNFWRVPGGRPDFGEKAEDTLKREMKEELDIEIEIIKFLGFGEDVVSFAKKPIQVSRLMLYFECKMKDETKRLSTVNNPCPDEISEIKWLSMNEIKNHQNLEPGMIDFFKRFDRKR